MSRRRPRVPGAKQTADYRREIATAGRAAETLLHVLYSLPVGRGQVWRTSVHHDDGCPAIDTGPIGACTCEIVSVEARRVA